MVRKFNKALALTAIALGVATLTGCKFTGGGSIPSVSGIDGEKATLAINGKCDGTEMTLAMQYNEHGTNLNQVRFHVDSTIDLAEFGETCDTTPGMPVGLFIGEYCPQPYGQWKNEPNAGCGIIEIAVGDGGEGYYAPDQDAVVLGLIGGAFDGYFNEGYLQGNIQTH
jgi:hypothetical protein